MGDFYIILLRNLKNLNYSKSGSLENHNYNRSRNYIVLISKLPQISINFEILKQVINNCRFNYLCGYDLGFLLRNTFSKTF